MKKATVLRNGDVLIPHIDITCTFWERFCGLMFRRSIADGYGLLIKPCNQIHMFNMKFPLDIIYLSVDNTVVHIDRDIKPWQIGKLIKDAAGVIEVNTGTCERLHISTGDFFDIKTSL